MNLEDNRASGSRCPVSHSKTVRVGQAADPPSLADVANLVDSEAIYLGILDSAMDAIITLNERQMIVLFNKAAEKMFRCSRDQAIGQAIDMFIPQRFREVHRHHVENFDHSQVADRAMGLQRPLAALRADGEEFPIEASISQAEVKGRKHFTAIIRDISERVRAQRLLNEMEIRYRTIFEHAGVGILMIDQHNYIIDANPATEKLLAYTKDELHNKDYCDLVHPHNAGVAKLHSWFDRFPEKQCLEFELRFLSKEKRRVWARVIHSAVKSTLYSPLYFVVIIQDITRKINARRRLKKLRVLHEATINCFALLTEREREVLWLMVDGNPTKIIAAELGISQKTVDVHRGRVMTKMRSTSLAQLVQMVLPIRKYCHHFVR